MARLTMRPRFTAVRAPMASVQRCTFLYSCTERNSADVPYAPPLDERPVRGPDRHVGDRALLAAEVLALGEAAVEHVQLARDLHRVAVDRVLDLDGGAGVEMSKATAEEGGAAHLPEEPGERLGARSEGSAKAGVPLKTANVG